MNILDQLHAAVRLEQMGITVRSAEIRAELERIRHFLAHGNRDLRRGRAVPDGNASVPAAEKQRRRRAGKAARTARRRNRP